MTIAPESYLLGKWDNAIFAYSVVVSSEEIFLGDNLSLSCRIAAHLHIFLCIQWTNWNFYEYCVKQKPRYYHSKTRLIYKKMLLTPCHLRDENPVRCHLIQYIEIFQRFNSKIVSLIRGNSICNCWLWKIYFEVSGNIYLINFFFKYQLCGFKRYGFVSERRRYIFINKCRSALE